MAPFEATGPVKTCQIPTFVYIKPIRMREVDLLDVPGPGREYVLRVKARNAYGSYGRAATLVESTSELVAGHIECQKNETTRIKDHHC